MNAPSSFPVRNKSLSLDIKVKSAKRKSQRIFFCYNHHTHHYMASINNDRKYQRSFLHHYMASINNDKKYQRSFLHHYMASINNDRKYQRSFLHHYMASINNNRKYQRSFLHSELKENWHMPVDDGNKTDIVLSSYDDHFLVIVTQIGSMGTILQARIEEGMALSPTFNVSVIFGKRDEPMLVACARQLIGHISSCGSSRPLLLSLGLKDHSLETVKGVVCAVIDNRLW